MLSAQPQPLACAEKATSGIGIAYSYCELFITTDKARAQAAQTFNSTAMTDRHSKNSIED
jgi:hypothetical protein